MKKVKLIKTHIHAGVAYAAGDVLEMTDADADFVVARGIGQVKSKPKITPQPAETTSETAETTPETAEKTPETDEATPETDDNTQTGAE